MKTRLMQIVCLALLLGMFTVAWADVVVGTGTTTTVDLPINTYYGFSYTQQIYTAAQIGSAITILGLKFYYSSGGTTSSNNWTIYLGHTSKTDFTSPTDWIPLSQLTQVYSGNLVMPTAPGWWEISLGSQFAYNGTSNLVIAIDENTPGYAYTNANWYSFASGTNSAIYHRNNGTNPNPNSPPAATGRLSTPNQVIFVTPSAIPPNPAGNPTPSDVAINVVNSPNLSWSSGGGTPSHYDVYFGTVNPPATKVSELQPGTTYNPGTLAYGQTYYWKVDPYNTTGYASTVGVLPVWSFTVMDDPTITALDLPYIQNFEDTWTETPAAPVGWKVINANADTYTWNRGYFFISPTHSGSYAAHGLGNTNDYLITPPIDLTGIDARIKWWDKVDNEAYINSYRVLVSTTDTNIASFVNDLGTYNCANTAWTEHILNLDAYSGQTIFVAFYQFASASAWDGFGIDDFMIDLIPAEATFEITPTSWDFGQVDIMGTASKQFTISNTGAAPFTLTSFGVTAGADNFSISIAPDMEVAAGTSTNFIVLFDPTAVQSYTGAITIEDNIGTKSLHTAGSKWRRQHPSRGFLM